MKRPVQYLILVGILMIVAPVIQQRISMFGDPAEVSSHTLRTMCLSVALMALGVVFAWTSTLKLLTNPPRWIFWTLLLVSVWLMTRVLHGELPAVVGFILALRDRGRFYGSTGVDKGTRIAEQEAVTPNGP
jgi:membrane glycosyltransferase